MVWVFSRRLIGVNTPPSGWSAGRTVLTPVKREKQGRLRPADLKAPPPPPAFNPSWRGLALSLCEGKQSHAGVDSPLSGALHLVDRGVGWQRQKPPSIGELWYRTEPNSIVRLWLSMVSGNYPGVFTELNTTIPDPVKSTVRRLIHSSPCFRCSPDCCPPPPTAPFPPGSRAPTRGRRRRRRRARFAESRPFRHATFFVLPPAAGCGRARQSISPAAASPGCRLAAGLSARLE